MNQEWQNFIQLLQQSKDSLNVCGLNQFSYYTVEGDKARDYLQGQLTNDMTLLSPTHWLRAAHCNNKGRVLGLYHIYEATQGIILQLPSIIAETAIPALNKFAKFSRVKITAINELMSFAIWGDQAGPVLKDTFGVLPTDENNCTHINDIIIAKDPWVNNSYQIISPMEQSEALCKILSEDDMLSDDTAWKHLNLSHGIAELHPETIEEFTPHNLNLPQMSAVNFNKGCYTGQEVIARMEFRGKLKSHLYYGDTELSDSIRSGQTLFLNERAVGQLVDMNQHQQALELLMLLKDSEADKAITIEENGFPITNITKL